MTMMREQNSLSRPPQRSAKQTANLKERKLCACIFFLSMFIEGFLGELIGWSCLIFLMRGSSKRIKNSFGKKACKVLWGYVIVFALLYVIQLCINPAVRPRAINLFGLTKCMCAPALFCFAFSDDVIRPSFIRRTLYVAIALNLYYFVNRVLGDPWPLLIGSENVLMAMNAFFFLVTFKLIREKKLRIGRMTKLGMACYGQLFTGAVNLVFFRSGTAFFVIALQLAIVGLLRMNNTRKIRKLVSRIAFVAAIALIIITYVIASGAIDLQSMSLGTRVAIWQQAVVQVGEFSKWHLIFGSGEDIVHMWTKSLQAHNFIMEVFMIYGIVGVLVLIVAMVAVFKWLLKKRSKDQSRLIILLLTYVVICFMHPFFTGMYEFQWFAAVAFLYLYQTREIRTNKD